MKGENKMGKFNLSKLVKSAQMSISKHSPEILTGIGIAGMVTTAVLAVKATPKALKIIESMEHIDSETKTVVTPTKIECVKATWKCYIPAAVTGVTSVACLIGASSVNVRRNAALATAYSLSETALREYKEKVVETIGDKKEKVVREAIDKDHVEKNPVSKSEVIITEKGNTLCYDTLSGRYFKSDIDKIKKAVNELNRTMLNDMYVSLNEFYDELGLDNISLGYELGWNIDNGLIDIDFSSQLAEDGTPCVVISYNVAPKYNYSRLT